MTTQAAESEELKSLTRNPLALITWPVRIPRDNASFLNEFQDHIRIKFQETSPNKYSGELSEFATLRNIAINQLSENVTKTNNSLKLLKKYYCQLASMLSRFRESAAEFSWKDSFSRHHNSGNIEFEMNNIMYNIATIHNELGAKLSKSDESTTKEACTNFSSALWWITELRDNRTGLKPKEMGHDLLTFFHHVLKAQSQECVLFHSIKASMNPGNAARISAQVASDYEIAAKLAQTPLYTDPIKEIIYGASIFQNWKASVEFKQKYFASMTQLLSGLSNSDDDAKTINIRVARLKLAHQIIEPARRLISDTLDSQTTRAAFEVLETLITKKMERSIRFNDTVYHSKVPSQESLSQIEPMLVIAPAVFSVASFPHFKDLFSNLVTIESVQVNSIYSQQKDDLSRTVRDKVEKQDEELAHMMSTMYLDKRSLALPESETSDELMEICAELSMNPNIVDDVLTRLEELDDKSEEIQKMLDYVESTLKKQPNRQFEEELKHHRSTHNEAMKSSQMLHKQLYPELQKKIQLMATSDNPLSILPKLEGPSAEDKEIVRKLEKLLDKVDEMKEQRARLVMQLKQSLDQDDVIKHVVAASSDQNMKNVFESEIQKHNKYVEPLMENLKLQKEMLDTLEKVIAEYGQVKLNHRSRKLAYTEKVESLKKFYKQFKSTSDSINQGHEYHVKMFEVVKNFYCKVQASSALNDLLN